MDTLIERKKRFTPKQIYGGVGVLFILVLILYFIFRDAGSSMTIDKAVSLSLQLQKMSLMIISA